MLTAANGDPTLVLQDTLKFNFVQYLRTGNPILDVIISGVIISLLSWAFSHYTNVMDFIRKFFNRRKHIGGVSGELIFSGEETSSHYGEICRDYPPSFRAILHYIERNCLTSGEIKTLRELRTNESEESIIYTVAQKDEFKLADAVLCRMEILSDNGGDGDESKKSGSTNQKAILSKTNMYVYSYTKDVQSLREFVAHALTEYLAHMNARLENESYYFISKVDKENRLFYQQYTFSSNRAFSNIFFSQKRELVQRLQFFLDNKAWYDARGVPYTLGFLFYGPPGTGKTSTIKAMANMTGRHIVEVSLGRITTYRQLQSVFHDTSFCGKHIPHDRLIYILEDIDCLGKLVQSRRRKTEKKKQASLGPKDSWGDALKKAFMKETPLWKNEDELTLSHILNVIDGLLETPGRIIIITTNHPEKLDEALIRPGRVDMKVEFGRSSAEDISDILKMFYESDVPAEDRAALLTRHEVWTAAEIYQICFKNSTMEGAIHALCTTLPKYFAEDTTNALSHTSQTAQKSNTSAAAHAASTGQTDALPPSIKSRSCASDPARSSGTNATPPVKAANTATTPPDKPANAAAKANISGQVPASSAIPAQKPKAKKVAGWSRRKHRKQPNAAKIKQHSGDAIEPIMAVE